jgi:GT2 family glycosyltransferase
VISIVVPTFNTATLTLHCCKAVVDAVDDATEIIVVDDGSTDGTAERLAREVPRVRVLRRAVNGGFAVAANEGVRASSRDLILLLNSDALLDRDALKALVGAFARDAKLGVASAQLFDEDGTPQWTGGRTPTLLWIVGAVSGKGHLARVFRRGGTKPPSLAPDWVSGAAMIFRREVWNAAGPLEERYRFYCQDIDFCLHARAHGWGVAIVPDAHVTHLRGATIGRTRNRTLLRDDLLEWGRGYYGPVWFFFARMVMKVVPVGN